MEELNLRKSIHSLLEESGSTSTLRLRVDGTSMAPMIQMGDRVVVRRAAAADLKRGDVVAYFRDDILYTHRLIGVGAQGCRLKADSSSAADPWVAEENILGVVTGLEKRNGEGLDFSQPRAVRLNRFLGWLGEREANALERRARHGVGERLPIWQVIFFRWPSRLYQWLGPG